MDTLTRFFNLLSAVVVLITGAYVHRQFGAVLSVELIALIWVLGGAYLSGQLEKNYRLVTKLVMLIIK